MRKIASFVLSIVALSMVVVSCGQGPGGNGGFGDRGGGFARGGDWGKPERPKFKIPVTVQQMERGRMYAYLQAVGSVVPYKEIELKPEMTGRVYYTRKWMEGNEIKNGEVFATVDDRELRLNINEAELQLEMAKNAVKPASAQLEQAKKDEEFKKTMEARGAISKAELDQAVLTRIQRQNQYEEALKNIESREMALKKLKQELEKVEIIVPFDGVLLPSSQSVTTGQSSDKSAHDLTLMHGQMVGQSTVLCRLANIEQVYVALDIPAKDLLEIRVGQEVELEIYSRSGHSFRGIVDDISTTLNSGTRTYTVNVLVDNVGRELRPGMFAKARIITQEKLDALAVPRSIIQMRNNREVVFVAVEKPKQDFSEQNGQRQDRRPGFENNGAEGNKPVVKANEGEKVAFAAEVQPEPAGEPDPDGDMTGQAPEAMEDEVPAQEDEVEMIVEERVITRGIENRELVEVTDGLRAGDLLVVFGYETLTDKVDVNVTEVDDAIPTTFKPMNE